jgi:hypothetical protein
MIFTEAPEMTRKFLGSKTSAVQKVAACIVLFLGIPSLMLAEDIGWPREMTQNGAHIVYYQPQIDQWLDYRILDARMAISVTPVGGKPTPGVISMEARTDANKEDRTVVISSIKLTDTRFPSANPADAAKLGELVRTFFKPDDTITISLDRLMAEVEAGKVPGSGVKVDNNPPKIFVSRGPTVLLLVDNKEVRAPIEKTKLEFVVNANWTVLFDTVGKKYYLLNGKQWLTAAKLEGPWTVAAQLPKVMSTLPADQNWQEIKKAIPPQGPVGAAPTVFFSDVPAEVIEFKGAPVYARIPGTQLTYATNTKSAVFVQTGEQQYYFLVSGRWFRSKSLNGPWSYASADLPADFAKIPPNGPGSNVLASVPGTQEAKDAVLLAQIPTTAIVNIKEAEAQVKVQYDGQPQFKPIETTPLSYATNTQDKIIKVGDIYYLCFQAVWFMSTTPNGPWKVVSSVPKEIYTIPPSSPVYNVTYVTQTQTSPTTVECDHTAGYLGMFLVGAAVGLTIAYGTGYYYPPYYYYPRYGYPIYRPYPVTYGVGAFYNPHSGTYGVARGAYGPYGGVTGAAWYNPSTGRYGRSVSAYGPYGSATAARTYNPYTGVYGATRQGSNAYGNWGSSVAVRGDQWAQTAHRTNSQGTAAGFRTSEGARGAGYSGANGNSGFVAQGKNDNMYAGKNGDVYRKDSSGSWQKYENGGWSDTTPRPSPHAQNATRTQGTQAQQRPAQGAYNRPAVSQQPAISSGTIQQLDRDAQARQTGTQRTQQFQRAQQQGGERTRLSAGGARRR